MGFKAGKTGSSLGARLVELTVEQNQLCSDQSIVRLPIDESPAESADFDSTRLDAM